MAMAYATRQLWSARPQKIQTIIAMAAWAGEAEEVRSLAHALVYACTPLGSGLGMSVTVCAGSATVPGGQGYHA